MQADSLPTESQEKPKNIGVGSLSLLQWIFPTQESNQGFLHGMWQADSLPTELSGKPLTGTQPTRSCGFICLFFTRASFPPTPAPFFPSIKKFFPCSTGICMWLTMVADPELQFSVDPNKPMCAGEISGSLLVWGQQILSTAQVSITPPLDTTASKLQERLKIPRQMRKYFVGRTSHTSWLVDRK